MRARIRAGARIEREITDESLPDHPTVEEIALWLRKKPATIYGWARDGKIPCRRIGRSYIFDKAALLQWVKPQWLKPQEAA